MSNIWGFLLQTISVSLVAGLLLFMKRLLEDKLSPRWQYGVWSILALRILLPVSLKRYILLPIPLYVETWKAMTERRLDSIYSAVYEPISLGGVFPVISGKPESITDWLFIVYVAGIFVFLLHNLTAFVRLHLLLRKGEEVSVEIRSEVYAICQKYGVKPCHVVTVKGLPSAFICGVHRPVLAVPADRRIDNKVLLHEILHLKYHDALQNVFWCILRALHWCNPLVHYVCNRIGNDMESLCDQRVLEQLEGEERRKYGMILLDMADDKYARAPGTTSISNGGKSISRRIAAIVRFKKYPRGMALVSVCIVILLTGPSVLGNKNVYATENYNPEQYPFWKFERAMAVARINRCSTVAGAVDTYAKGLLYENGIYLASASSLSKHEKLEEEMQFYPENEQWERMHVNVGSELLHVNTDYGYSVYNLTEKPDGSYEAVIVIQQDKVSTENSNPGESVEDGSLSGYVVIPVRILYEDAWVIEENGERKIFKGNAGYVFSDLNSDVPWLKVTDAEGESGEVTLRIRTWYTVDNTVQTTGLDFFGYAGFDHSVKTDAVFERGRTFARIEYQYDSVNTEKKPETCVGIQMAAVVSEDKKLKFPDVEMTGNHGGGSSDGYDWINQDIQNGEMSVVCTSENEVYRPADQPIKLPEAYKVRAFWDGNMVEEFTLEVPKGGAV